MATGKRPGPRVCVRVQRATFRDFRTNSLPGCESGCTEDAVPGGLAVRRGCDNTAVSATNCGACSAACESPFMCVDSKCAAADCGVGHAECDGDTSHTCETDTKSDPKNCGGCGQDCGADLCSGGHCTKMDCAEGSADCDANPENGCEVNLTEVDNCGMCGAVCSSVHGTPGCDDKGCNIVCADQFGDCDARVGTGCETPLTEDTVNCGACGTACKNDHGTTTCAKGKCTPLCATGYLDCDGDPKNGCETEVAASLTDCGACGAKCALDHASEKCDAGVCKVTACDTGFDNCDGDAKNGCEADLTLPVTCGSCANKCSENGGKASCSAGKCSIRLRHRARRLQKWAGRRLRNRLERERDQLQRVRQGMPNRRWHRSMQRRQMRHLELHGAARRLQRRRAAAGWQRLRDESEQQCAELRRLRQRVLLPERVGQMRESRLRSGQVPERVCRLHDCGGLRNHVGHDRQLSSLW